jgi:hypothetical protein
MAFRTNKMPVLQEKTASGAIASFDTILTKPLEECTSLITGYQEGSGTPSPSNVRPLHAFSSASLGVNTINQWDEQWEVGYINETTGQVQAGYKFISKNFIPCLPNTQYRKLGTLGVAPAYYGWLLFYYYDENHNFIGRDSQWTADGVFTTPANCHFMKFRSYSDCSSYGNDISINYPATDTSYHAFNGAVFTFGQSIYQGSIDWLKGVVVGLWSGKVDMGLLNWGYNSSFQAFYISLPNMYIPTTGQERLQGIANEVYPISTVDAISLMNDKSCLRYNGYLWIKDSDYTDRDDFKNSLIGKYAAYELATPIEIPLGGVNLLTQQGQNNIYCDTGDTSLVFNDLDIAKRGSFREVFRLP